MVIGNVQVLNGAPGIKITESKWYPWRIGQILNANMYVHQMMARQNLEIWGYDSNQKFTSKLHFFEKLIFSILAAYQQF